MAAAEQSSHPRPWGGLPHCFSVIVGQKQTCFIQRFHQAAPAVTWIRVPFQHRYLHSDKIHGRDAIYRIDRGGGEDLPSEREKIS